MKTIKIAVPKILLYTGLLALAISCKKDKPAPVPAPAPLPEISFTATVVANSSPVKAEFNNTSLYSNSVTWEWNFGDDSVSTQKSPVHYYYSPGTYTVTLTAKLNGNTISVVTKAVIIAKDPMLLAWYKLNNLTYTDDATGNNNNIVSLSNVITSDISGHTGIDNTAVKFLGAGSRILLKGGLISNQAVNTSGAAEAAISMWVNLDDVSGYKGLFFMKSEDGNAYVPVLFSKDNQLRGMFWDNPLPEFVPMSSDPSKNVLTAQKWHHIVLAGDKNGQSLYLDGVKIASRNGAINHLNMYECLVGYMYVKPGGEWFRPEVPNIQNEATYSLKGRVDDIRIYKKRLSDAEVIALSKE